MAYLANTRFEHDGEVAADVGDKVTQSEMEKMGHDWDALLASHAVIDEDEGKVTPPASEADIIPSDAETDEVLAAQKKETPKAAAAEKK
jgi:hypothetical protein